MMRAILLDALGTLMTFEPPAPHLQAAIRERHGVDVPDDTAAAAMKAEIAYYRAHLYEGRDAASLHDLRVRGLRIGVVSNWDASLHERLAETGLAPLVDGAVASAELGHAKPDPRIFAHALELAGVPPEAALHAGDTLEADVEGALAAGLHAVLVARDGPATAPPGVPVVTALTELPALSPPALREAPWPDREST